MTVWTNTGRWLAALFFLLFSGSTSAVAAQEIAGRPAERAVEQFRYQWEAAFLGGAVVARENGQSLEEFGAALGRVFAPSWGENVTVASFARGMASNFNLMGQDAEATVTDDEATVRWLRLEESVFEERNGDLGITYAEYESLLTAVVSAIAAQHGLHWEEQTNGAHRTARVTRR